MAIAGKVAITPKGNWSASTAYQKLDLVYYNNGSYVAIQPSTGVTPTNTAYWMLVLQSENKADIQSIINGETKVGDADKLDGHNSSYFAKDSDLAIERERITNLATLTEGSTTGDAELADIRVGADGKTYENAGEAVRGQISDLKSDLSELEGKMCTEITDIAYIDGVYVNRKGNEGALASFKASDYIDISSYIGQTMDLYSSIADGAGFAVYNEQKVCIYGEDGSSLGETIYGKYSFTIPSDSYYIRFSIRKSQMESGRIVIWTPQTSMKEVKDYVDAVIPKNTVNYAYAVENVLCIGDSLTSGACYVNGWTGASIDQNYPRYLARMLNCETTNAGVSGISASGWYRRINNYNFTDYDAFVIWLGTNYGCGAMPTDDEINTFVPNDSVSAENANQALYLIEIIKRIQVANPDAYILLCTCFSSSSNVATNNATVGTIAEKYGCVLLDMSDLGASNHLELHGGIVNPHFGKAGNIFIADRICKRINEDITANPLRAEFGYTERTN